MWLEMLLMPQILSISGVYAIALDGHSKYRVFDLRQTNVRSTRGRSTIALPANYCLLLSRADTMFSPIINLFHMYVSTLS